MFPPYADADADQTATFLVLTLDDVHNNLNNDRNKIATRSKVQNKTNCQIFIAL